MNLESSMEMLNDAQREYDDSCSPLLTPACAHVLPRVPIHCRVRTSALFLRKPTHKRHIPAGRESRVGISRKCTRICKNMPQVNENPRIDPSISIHLRTIPT